MSIVLSQRLIQEHHRVGGGSIPSAGPHLEEGPTELSSERAGIFQAGRRGRTLLAL